MFEHRPSTYGRRACPGGDRYSSTPPAPQDQRKARETPRRPIREEPSKRTVLLGTPCDASRPGPPPPPFGMVLWSDVQRLDV